MRKLYVLLVALFLAQLSFGQISGTFNIPGAPYATIAAAITAINTSGVGAGGVTFNVTAGYTETFASPTAGYITTNSGTAANQIVFQKSGAGANPLITAGTGTGTLDAIICFNGVQYVTFNGIDVAENAANITTATQMEWGYAVLKASATQGSQYITVKNCTITLNKTNTSTYGIYSNNHTTAINTQLTVTAITGQNSNNKFYGNTITNSYGGIYLNGYADGTAPYTYYDQNNDIGSVTGNIFTNFAGGASTSYQVYVGYQNGVKIANCNINGGAGSTGSLYGIYGSTANNSNIDIYGNTITLVSAATTSYIYAIYSLLGSGTTNTVNIYNNTVQNCTQPTATSAYFYGIYNGATAFNTNFYGNIVNNNVIGGSAYTYTAYTTAGTGACNVYNNSVTNNQRTGSGASGYFYCLSISGSAATSIHDNTVSGNACTALAGFYVYMYSLYCSNSAISQTVYNNTVHDQTVVNGYTSGYAIYGIYSYPSSTNPSLNSVYNNTVYNLSFTCTSSAYCYIYGIGSYYANNVYSNTVHDITQSTTTSYGYSYAIYDYYGLNLYSNTIYNINETATTGYGYGYGAYLYASGPGNIYKNKVYGISMAGSTSGGYYYGIYLSNATAGAIYNNYVSDIKAPNSQSTTGVNGIYISSATTAGVYYNTVYLNATSSSTTTFNSAAFYTSTTPTVDMRNNIFVNTSTAPGSTTYITSAYRRSSTTLTSYAATSNNNDFYAGTPSATNVIMYDGTASYQNLAAYKTLVTPRDAASITELAPFVNIATTPYNLHVQTSVATQCESGGANVATYTDDYDGDIRQGNAGYAGTGSAPDIGADEFNGILLDLTPPGIVYTPFLNTNLFAARTLTTTITDASGVPTTGAGLPRLYWKINSGTWNSVAGTFVSGSTYTFTFGAGVVLGDVVSYYIVAQDGYSTPNVGAAPSLGASGFSINPPACSTPPTTPSSYTIVGSLCGNFNVGVGQTYTTLTAAFNAINNNVITCPIVMTLTDASYSASETFPLVLNYNTGSSPTNTVTIKPAAGVSPVISGAAAANALIKILNPNTIIDGSNSGGATRNLTINNTSATTPQVLFAASNGSGFPISNFTIKNCILINGVNSSSALVLTNLDGNGGYFNNITIQNNSVQLAYIGIYYYVNALPGNGSALITANDLNTAGANSIRLAGIYIQGADGVVASNNNIGNIVNTLDASNESGIWVATSTINSTISGNTISLMSGSTGGPRGIVISSGVTGANVNVTGNTITNISTASSANAMGIYFFSTTTGCNITNNLISNIKNSNSGGWNATGIYLASTAAVSAACNVINNAIWDIAGYGYSSYNWNGDGMIVYSGFGYNIYHNTVFMNTDQTVAGIPAALFVYSSVTNAGAIDLRDNIFATTQTLGTDRYAIYCQSANTVFSNIDYNDYYSTGANLGYIGSNRATLTDIQTGFGGNVNSLSANPTFVGSDLHFTNAALYKKGTYMAAVPTDLAGAGRTNPPDMGVYEVSPNQLVVTIAASGILTTSATLNGSINASNATVTSGYDYGLTVAYGSSVAGLPASVTGASVTPFTGAVSGLNPGTLYHFRAKGVSGGVTVYGSDLTFTTTAVPPTVVTTAATGITGTTATINGTVNANGSSTTVTFDYGLTVAYGTTVPGVPSPVTGVVVTNVSAALTGLLPGTLYHYRVNGVNAGGTVNGGDLTFTTPALPPTVVTTAATGIGTSTATLNGTVNANGASATDSFDWGLTVAYGNTVAGTPSPISGNTVTNVSTNLTGLAINTTYHYRLCATNSAGSNCGTDMTFLTGCPIAGPAGPISGPSQACQGQCGYVYSVTIPNATGYVWTPPVGGTITSGANTNTITVCYAANAVSGYVFVYGTAACGNGAPSQLAITMNPPASPTITGPANSCVNSTGNVYTTEAGKSAYVWTVSAGGTITAGAGTNAITVTWNTTGAKTVCVNYNTAAGCPALAPVCYNVTVNPLPVPTISGPSPACSNYPGLVYSTQAGMSNYIWAVSAGGTITAGPGTNAITVTWNTPGAQTVSVNYTNANGCTAPALVVYPVTVNSGAAPTITGSNNLCVNSGYYNYTTQTGMSAYTWTVSPGGTINYGGGTNVVTVSWLTAGAQWIKVNYTNPSGCQAPSPTQYNVTVNPLPAATGSITGAATVCGGAMGVAYSVAPVTGAATYVWSLPAGATIATGLNTNSITVNFAGNATSGNITAYANNVCGNGAASPAFAVTVNALPADAGTIIGSASVCEGATGVVYSVATITGATGYTWTVPAGASLTSGAGTNSITVDFPAGAVSGNITVLGTNSCGNGIVSPNFAVTVNAIPAAPVVTNTGYTVYSSYVTGNQWYYSATVNGTGAPISGATAQTYDATLTGTGYYWSVVTLNSCASDTSNHKLVITTGIDSHSSSSINVYPVPNDGLFNVSITASNETFNISVYNSLGVKIYNEAKVEVQGSLQKVIDLRPVPNGVYTVIFENIRGDVVKKIVVNK